MAASAKQIQMNCNGVVGNRMPVVGVAGLESTFKWLNEYLRLLPVTQVGNSDPGCVKYVRSLLTETRLSAEEELSFRRDTDLGWKLNLAAQYTLVGDYEDALKCAKMAEDELAFHVMSKNMTKPSSSHIRVYNYTIQTSIMMILNQLITKYGIKSIDIGSVASVESLRSDWENIIADKKSMAVVHFFKACLAASIRLDDEIVLDELKKTVELEPDYYGWYRYLYRKFRQIRRSSRQMVPSNEEKLACQTAYKLRPDLGDNIANMASMLEEMLTMSKKEMTSEDVADKLDELVGLLKCSIKMTDDMWATLRLAEIYGFGNYYQHLDVREGERLFEKCIKKWPSNSMVWHKAGKFYHLGGKRTGGGPYMNVDKAREYYERALELSSSNYPCLMDYLKLLAGVESDHSMIIRVIDEHLPKYKKDYELQKLLIIKGAILWIHNYTAKDRLDACLCWLEIVKRFPKSVKEVVKSLKVKRMDVVGNMDLNVDEIVLHLGKLNEGEGSSAGNFISELLGDKDYNNFKVRLADKQKMPVRDTEAAPGLGLYSTEFPCLGATTTVAASKYVREGESQPGVAYISKGRGRGRGQTRT